MSGHALPQAKAASRFYRPELDVLRFLAFLLVFLHHVVPRIPSLYGLSQTASGILAAVSNSFGFGLPLFFCLSAFLITELLVKEKDRTGSIAMPSFYIRRILRIWPLYVVGLAVGVLYAWMAGKANPQTDYGNVTMLGMYLALCGNWYFAHQATWPANPFTALWSISIEEQFYLIWPMLVLFATRRRMWIACGGLAVIAVGTEFYLGSAHAPTDTTIWTNSFVQFEMFAVGAMLALGLRDARPHFTPRLRLAFVLATPVLWFVSAYCLHAKYIGNAESGFDIVIGYALIAAGCGCLMLAFLGLKIHWPKQVIYLGRISFGLYVFHGLALAILNKTIVYWAGSIDFKRIVVKGLASLILTILMAALSYKWLEKPFLRMKEKYTVIPSRPL